MPNEYNVLYEFGPFRLSPAQGGLMRNGSCVHLAPKTFDMLVILLDRRSGIVSKQELVQAVWPGLKHVEDSNLERRMSDLRSALAGGPEEKIDQYIKTFPKRGYQFVAPVAESRAELPVAAGSTPAPDVDDSPLPEDGAVIETETILPGLRQITPAVKRHRLMALVTVCVLALFGTIVVGLNALRNPEVPPPFVKRRSIAVLSFRNLSRGAGDPSTAQALGEMLRTEMAAAASLRAVPGEDVARMKLELDLPDTDSLSIDTLARIRKRVGADLVLLGSYLQTNERAEGQIRLDLRIQDTASGEIVASAGLAVGEAKLIELIRNSGSTLRKQLGAGDLSTAESLFLQAAHPTTPEVARLFVEGLSKLRLFDATAAEKLFERALEIDTNNPTIRSALAEAFWTLGFERRAREEARRAMETPKVLSRQDQLRIEGRFAEVARDRQRAVRIYTTLWTMFPDDPEYGLRLASSEVETGNGLRAYSVLDELRKLPGLLGDDPRIDLAEAAVAEALGDFKREILAATAAAEKSRLIGAKLLLASALLRQCWASNQLGDYKTALVAAQEAREIFAAVGDNGNEARALRNIGDVLDDSGDHIQGQKSYEDALAVFRRIGNSGGVAITLVNLGYAVRNRGDLKGAKSRFEEAAKIGREIGDEAREVLGLTGVGIILWRQGDLGGAEKIFRDVVQRYRKRDDKNRVAIVLGNLAIVIQDQGRLDEAERTFQESLSLLTEIGNRPSVARTLGNLGELQLRKGAIQPAQSSFIKQLEVARELNDGKQRAYALQGVGQVLTHQGDLTGARAKFQEALQIRQSLKETGLAAESQLALAELALEERDGSEACRYAREAAVEFRAGKQIDQEAVAQAFIANCLTLQGKLPQAKRTALDARRMLSRVEDVAARLTALIAIAGVDATSGDIGGLRKDLESVGAAAEKQGYIHLQYQANLILAESDTSSGSRARLEQFGKEARTRGYGLIARKADTRLRMIDKR